MADQGKAGKRRDDEGHSHRFMISRTTTIDKWICLVVNNSRMSVKFLKPRLKVVFLFLSEDPSFFLLNSRYVSRRNDLDGRLFSPGRHERARG